MAGEWRQFSLGDLCSLITDGKHGDCQDESGSGYYFLSVKDVFDNRLVYENAREITEVDFLETHRRTNLEPGDILFTNTGTIGRMAIAPDDLRTRRTTFQKSVAVLKPKRKLVEPHFLYYTLKFDNARLSELAAGTTQKNLLLRDFRTFSVNIPDLDEQRAIAHILGSLDDKIELNRRMNETLEAMARAVFKSWFVDFDPVRAKAEGRDPGLPKHIADLFPDRFEDSELGEIPAGWEIGPILKQAKLLSGGTPKTDRKEYWDGDILWASAKDVSQCGQTFLVKTERTITQKGLEESATQLIPAFCTVVVARGATTGRMVLFGREMAMNQTCYALGSMTDTPFALHCHLLREMDDLVHAAHGSVFDTIITSTFANSKVLFPPVPLLKAFDQKVSPMFQRILGNTEEIQTLASVRDALLPKLVSGELRVKDPESKALAVGD